MPFVPRLSSSRTALCFALPFAWSAAEAAIGAGSAPGPERSQEGLRPATRDRAAIAPRVQMGFYADLSIMAGLGNGTG